MPWRADALMACHVGRVTSQAFWVPWRAGIEGRECLEDGPGSISGCRHSGCFTAAFKGAYVNEAGTKVVASTLGWQFGDCRFETWHAHSGMQEF